jgi:hypothetical protein
LAGPLIFKGVTMQFFTVVGQFVQLFHGLVQLTQEQARDRAHALKETDETGVFEIKQPIGFKKGETFGFDGDPGKAALQLLEEVAEDAEPAAVHELRLLAQSLGKNIKDTAKLLKDKYDLTVQNNGKAPVPQAVAEKVAQDHEVQLQPSATEKPVQNEEGTDDKLPPADALDPAVPQ